MNYLEYKLLFDQILENPNPLPPYDDALYFDYTKLNKSRVKRWDKQMVLAPNLVSYLKNIDSKLHWIIISEPWCGDAAHIVPFLVQMAEQNDHFSYEIQLRDSEPFLIEKYLTNGSKSIPILVVRDDKGKDVFSWGPRPVNAQKVMDVMKGQNADFESIKIELQNWYNEDKGAELGEEIHQKFLENL